MKLAKAMRYGGELIDATECDYSDFKRLIPLCPNCGEPVFLRKGNDRVSSLGKSFKIPAHWSHFNSVSEEQKAQCEARVSGYSEEDRKRIQAKARGQRLKLIQRWFWRLLQKYCYEGVLSKLDNLLQEVDVISNEKTFNQLRLFLPSQKSFFHKNGEHSSKYTWDISPKNINGASWPAPSPWLLVDDPGEYGNQESFCQKIPKNDRTFMCLELGAFNYYQEISKELSSNRNAVSTWLSGYCSQENYGAETGALDMKICLEIVDFLCAKSSRNLFFSVLAMVLVVLRNSERGLWFTEQVASGYSLGHVGASGFCMIIGFVPWASEFARLEAEVASAST